MRQCSCYWSKTVSAFQFPKRLFILEAPSYTYIILSPTMLAQLITFLALLATCFVASVNAFDANNPPDELQIAVLHRPEKCVRKVLDDDIIKIHYVGKIYKTQEEFDSSRGHKPIQFTMGEKRVIPAWEFGSKGMCVGEIRRLLVPSKYAYGPIGVKGFVEPDEAVIFEIELLEIYSPFDSPYFWASLGALVLMLQMYWWAMRAEQRKLALQQADKDKDDIDIGGSNIEEIEVDDDDGDEVIVADKKND